MAIRTKLLNDGEHVIWATRTHVKVLFVPAVVLLLLAGVAGYLSSLPDGDSAKIWLWLIWGVAAVLFVVFCVWPFLNWWTSTYVFTNRRLITRHGVLTRRGHDVPLNRISDVTSERGVTDRILGCGTLVIADASEQGRVELHDIPKVERAQLTLQDALFSGGNRHDDGA